MSFEKSDSESDSNSASVTGPLLTGVDDVGGVAMRNFLLVVLG